MKSRLSVWLFCLVSIIIVFNKQVWNKNPYTYDSFGYYLYLPATFIYHDLDSLNFFPAINNKYHAFEDSGKFSIINCPGGKKNDKYAIGASFFELPLFLAAHIYCKTTNQYIADGFSLPYQLAGKFSAILWVLLGLFVLRKFLLNYYNDTVTAITLLCIAFGTNLFYYTAFDPGLSHPYSFFLFAAVLYCTDNLYRNYESKYLVLLGLLMGLVTITRPVNIVITFIPLLWGVYNIQTVKDRIKFYTTHKAKILVAKLLFFLILFLQLAYWKYTSGHWFYFSYKGDGFNFLNPQVEKGLFSYRKGWFVYTPLAFISMIGMVAVWKKNRQLAPSIIVFFIALVYIVFSWKNWWYGGGFGCRPLIESLAVAALPLAALTGQILSRRKLKWTLPFCSFLTLCIILNIFQTYQFCNGIIHHDRMSKEYYWHVFGKTHINPDDYEKYLMNEKEYWKELLDISK